MHGGNDSPDITIYLALKVRTGRELLMNVGLVTCFQPPWPAGPDGEVPVLAVLLPANELGALVHLGRELLTVLHDDGLAEHIVK